MRNNDHNAEKLKWNENSDKISTLDLEELERNVDSEADQQDDEDTEYPRMFDTLGKPEYPEKANPEFFVPNKRRVRDG